MKTTLSEEDKMMTAQLDILTHEIEKQELRIDRLNQRLNGIERDRVPVNLVYPHNALIQHEDGKRPVHSNLHRICRQVRQ